MTCLECGREFDSEKSLHSHLRAHKLKVADYYQKHFPRACRATGKPLLYKNFNGPKEYLEGNFNGRREMRSYFRKVALNINMAEEALEIGRSMIYKLMEDKGTDYCPSEFELMSSNAPTLSAMMKIRGFDLAAPYLFKPEKVEFKSAAPSFYVDTREQQPWDMPNPIKMKLEIGDYAAAGDRFSNVFVDRKGAADFIGTFTSGYERFKREMDRAAAQEAFLFVIVEGDLAAIYKKCNTFKRKASMDFALHNARELMRLYKGHVQIVMAKDREEARDLAIKALSFGPNVVKYDLQFMLNN